MSVVLMQKRRGWGVGGALHTDYQVVVKISYFVLIFLKRGLKALAVEAAECGENTIAKLRADLNAFI